MKKEMKPDRMYIFCNVDEPYAHEVFEVIKRGQMAKGTEHWPEGNISFEEWMKSTFCRPCPFCGSLDLDLSTNTAIKRSTGVFCTFCRSGSGMAPSITQAIMHWNGVLSPDEIALARGYRRESQEDES